MVGKPLPVQAARMNRLQTHDVAAAGPATTGLLLNIAAFQLGWFACVLGAAHGWPWAGVAVAVAVVALHLARAASPMDELKLIVFAVLIGALWDSLLVSLGWIAYPGETLITGAAPHWILALWALFATTLNVSMRWLKQRLLMAFVLGAVCGPLSYWAAVRLGAVQFIEPLHIVIALALGWALIMPLLMLLSRRFDGITPIPKVAP